MEKTNALILNLVRMTNSNFKIDLFGYHNWKDIGSGYEIQDGQTKSGGNEQLAMKSWIKHS